MFWNPKETTPKDGTRIRILWSNGEVDVGAFKRMRPDQAETWKEEYPELYEQGGEWSTDYGNGYDSEPDPIGWAPL